MSDVADSVARKPLTVAVMDQVPKTEVPAESPLHHRDLASQPNTVEQPGVYAWEDALRGHLVLRGNADDPAFVQGVEAALELALPGRLQSTLSESLSLRWVAPDEWLLVCDNDRTFALETRLREHLEGHCAIINVSGGQTLIRLAGVHAVDALKKSAPYDFGDRNFPVGKVVSTVFAKNQAMIRRVGDQEWELTARRSFADYLWRWLAEAAREYGLHIGPPDQNRG